MTEENSDRIRSEVRRHYAAVAVERASCGCSPTGCCSTGEPASSARLGYSGDDLAAVPAASDLGLGCGTPVRGARLARGDVVVDLGSGGGLDCFLAAREVGPEGKVIGVDMTPEMIERARASARTQGWKNIEFRLGEIEHLPVADNTADWVLSNCVVNLSPDKEQVFRESFRVLKPGGRLSISDVVATRSIPESLRSQMDLHASCIAGAATPAEIAACLAAAGFQDIRVDVQERSREFIRDWLPGSGIEQYLSSALIHAKRPTAVPGNVGQASGGDPPARSPPSSR